MENNAEYMRNFVAVLVENYAYPGVLQLSIKAFSHYNHLQAIFIPTLYAKCCRKKYLVRIRPQQFFVPPI